MSATLQPGAGRIRAAAYLPSTPATVLWGRLPCATDAPVLRIERRHRGHHRHGQPRGPARRPGQRPAGVLRGPRRRTGRRARPTPIEIVGTLTRDPRRRAARGDRTDPRRGRDAGRPAGDHRPGDHPARPVRRDLEPARPRRAAGRAPARRRRTSACSPRCDDGPRLPARRRGRRAPDRVPAGTRSSGSWASRSPGTTARTRCRPARTAATSTSTCSRWAARSTCRCRCRARWRTWATRTSRRATARWR